MKRCISHEGRVCNDCGECDDRCELNPDKICDNCFRCLEEDSPAYAQIPISGVYLGDDFVPERETAFSGELDDGFLPELFDDWEKASVVEAKTLPMTYGMRVRRAHPKR